MARIVLGGVVGGVVLFFWGFVAHMLLPLGDLGIKSLPNDDALSAAIKQDVRESGLYMLPGMDPSQAASAEAMEAYTAKVAKGPSGLMVLFPGGRDLSLARHLPIELGTNVASSLLAAVLVSQLRPGFLRRVGVVTLVGLLASILTLVPYWNWYGFPADFTLAQIAENVIGSFLVGLVLAAIVRPASQVTSA